MLVVRSLRSPQFLSKQLVFSTHTALPLSHISGAATLPEPFPSSRVKDVDVQPRRHLCDRNLFEQSPDRGSDSWPALISDYLRHGLVDKAVRLLREVKIGSVNGNEFTFPSWLKVCAITKDLRGGAQIHGAVIGRGLESDEFVINSLISFYAKCREVGASRKFFSPNLRKSVVSWNALLSSFVQGNLLEEAIELFQDMLSSGIMPDEFSLCTMISGCTNFDHSCDGRIFHGYLMKLGYNKDPFSENSLVDMYSKAGTLNDALKAFNEIEKPTTISWNAAIAGCVRHENYHLGLQLFRKMKEIGMSGNMYTMSSALKSCAEMGLSDLGKQFHCSAIKMDLVCDTFITVGLIDMYSSCGLLEETLLILSKVREADMVAWNAAISGCAQNELYMEAISLFLMMHRKGLVANQTTISTILKSIAHLQDSLLCRQIHTLTIKSGFEFDKFVVNSLIDSYGKCSRVREAAKVFNDSGIIDLVTFTSMITVYSQDEKGEDALELYSTLLSKGIKPDPFLCSSLLNACANLSAYEQGKQVHVHVLKFAFVTNSYSGNSLVNMYAKCGSIEDARRAFDEIPERGLVSWSAMIGGLAQHGHEIEALEFFNLMLQDGVHPNNVTLVSVLTACNNAGLVSDAKRYFQSMDLFGVQPTQEHYACMVDILGKAGKLKEAMELVKEMPFEANACVWGALLGAARIHKNVELGRQAAEMLLLLEPMKSSTHTILANLYASVAMWDEVAKVRMRMKNNKVKKEPGMSWIEVKDKVHTFIVGDNSHSRSEEIYAKIDELSECLSQAGYIPMVEIDLHDVGTNEKKQLLLHHSEKLALAFGLLAIPSPAPIRIKKNLRICQDCHAAIKLISKLISREIIVRDINRFHNFKDGTCSCRDYW